MHIHPCIGNIHINLQIFVTDNRVDTEHTSPLDQVWVSALLNQIKQCGKNVRYCIATNDALHINHCTIHIIL